MTYNAREISIQDGQPVELYTIVLSGRTYRLTSAEEDVTFDGYAYQATPGLGRGPITLKQVGKMREIEVWIGRAHEVAAVAMSNGIPPRTATLLLKQFHRGDTEARQLWSGNIDQARVDGVLLRMRVPSSADAMLNVSLPFAKVSRACQHMLYGVGCEVNRDYLTYGNHEFMSASDAVSQIGTTLVVSVLEDALGSARANQWAQFGEVRRVVDGERRSILSQTGTTLELDVPFAYVFGGDALEVYAGCDHQMTTCNSKFDNHQKFGGHPGAPDTNPRNNQDED